MPIYEYVSAEHNGCAFCNQKFEVRHGIEDKPLRTCPQCGTPVRRVFSRNFIEVPEPLSTWETFDTYTPEEADTLGLDGEFASDQVYGDDS